MTRSEGLLKINQVIEDLRRDYKSLDELNGLVARPVAADVQEKAKEILAAAISVACMAMNLTEVPQEAKRIIATVLYQAAETLTDGSKY